VRPPPRVPLLLAVALIALAAPLEAAADPEGSIPTEESEPGADGVRPRRADEPGLTPRHEAARRRRQAPGAVAPAPPAFRIDLGFGWASLLVDPDVGQGFGGGIFAAWGLDRRVGIEIFTFFAKNDYTNTLSLLGTSFVSGGVGAGPLIQLTRPGGRFVVTLDFGMGAYAVFPIVFAATWSLGISMGATVAVHITRNFALALRLRYHLFNLVRVSGPELVDLKAFLPVGVIDRLDLPLSVELCF
jgi:hypothetical protein